MHYGQREKCEQAGRYYHRGHDTHLHVDSGGRSSRPLVSQHVCRRLSIHKAYDELLRELYAEQVFATKVPHLMHFKEAIAARQPVTIYKPKSVAAEDIREQLPQRRPEPECAVATASFDGMVRLRYFRFSRSSLQLCSLSR